MANLYRGLAERKADGSLDIKLPNYSYAQDGLLIWNAIHEFAGDYLRLHYDDSKPGKRVGFCHFIVQKACWRMLSPPLVFFSIL